MIMCWAIARKY